MSSTQQSILQGGRQLSQLDLGPFRVTSAYFPSNLRLTSHYHPRACLALVLQGQVEKRFPTSTYEIGSHHGCTMPPEERHSDHFALAGAHILVIEPALTDAANQLFAPCQAILDEISPVIDPYLFLLAERLEQEIRHPDAVSNLVINGLALEMMAIASRGRSMTGRTQSMPLWLGQARDYLHDNFADSFRLDDLAAAVGVHPVHLARTFRRHFAVSPGEYLRRLRLEWVKERLLQGTQPLSQLAQEAGFSDQSHLTRQFKTHFGVTPGTVRRR